MKVLIGHKNKEIVHQIEQQISQRGAVQSIESLDQGKQVEDYIFRHKPDIAILDEGLEGIGALTIARRIQDAGVPTKIIVLTERMNDTLLLTGLAHGILGYLTVDNIHRYLAECTERVKSNLVFVEEDVSN